MPPATTDDEAPRDGHLPRGRWRRALAGIGALVAVVAMAAEPVQVRLVAATTVAEALDLPVPRPFAPEVRATEATVGGVAGHRYGHAPSAPPVVLVPGAVPAGLEDPRVARVATSVARATRTVFVPELAVYDRELVTEDVDRLVRVTTALADAHDAPVVLLGISFGGSLALLAAADERLEDRVAAVATFGAYADLLGVVQAATTGTAIVGDERVDWDADPRAGDVVRAQLLALLPPGDRGAVERALEGRRAPDTLPDELRAVHDLLVNEDPAATGELARRLPASVRERLAEVSPVTVADRLEVPVLAMHGVDDPAIPYAELLRLGHAVEHAELIPLSRFDHVGVELDSPRAVAGAAGDLVRVWRFTTRVLDAP